MFSFKKKCFSFVALKRLVESTLLSVLDYGDIISMPTTFQKIGWNMKKKKLNDKMDFIVLKEKKNMLILILKALVGKLPQYI